MLEEILKNQDNYDLIIGFKAKRIKDKITNQDKKHIRIMAILKMAKEGIIEKLMSVKFNESFVFDEEEQVAYYRIKFIKERKDQTKYADC